MAACAEVISPLTFYGAPKSQLYAVLSCKNYFPPPFSFLGSLPASIASAPEQLSPEQEPPVGPTGSGQRALAPPHPAGRGDSRLSTLGSPGVPGVAAGAARSCLAGAGVGRGAGATVPRHVEGREEPAFPQGTAFSRMRREQAAARLGCLAPQLLPGAGASV